MIEIKFQGENIIIVGRNHFLVESETCPGEHHAVDLEEMTCTCKGFLCRQLCRHLDLVELLNTSLALLPVTSEGAPDVEE